MFGTIHSLVLAMRFFLQKNGLGFELKFDQFDIYPWQLNPNVLVLTQCDFPCHELWRIKFRVCMRRYVRTCA